MSDFLNNLKKAVDSEEFNSDAANKINEINELAEKKISNIKDELNVGEIKAGASDVTKSLEDKIEERLEDAGIRVASEDEMVGANTEYEVKMTALKKHDLVNSQLALLIDIEQGVRDTINDMMEFVDETTERFSEDIKSNEMPENLHTLVMKITEIKNNYKQIK